MKNLCLLSFFLSILPVVSIAQTPDSIRNESITSIPDRDRASSRVEPRNYSTASRMVKSAGYSVIYANLNDQIEGFNFSNEGPNSVVTTAQRGIGLGPNRDWSFDFDERARQSIKMTITDVPTEFLSQGMLSYFYFFPRKVLPAVQWPVDGSSFFTVTLPTGEAVQFSTVSKEVVGGVLKETSPIDLGPDRFKRKFAAITYSGKGVYIRVDKRGADPRLGTMAVITQGKQTCKVPSAKLFDQDVNSAVLFLFASDAPFNEFLKKTCNMSFM
jgi:hypothetical protein